MVFLLSLSLSSVFLCIKFVFLVNLFGNVSVGMGVVFFVVFIKNL